MKEEYTLLTSLLLLNPWNFKNKVMLPADS